MLRLAWRYNEIHLQSNMTGSEYYCIDRLIVVMQCVDVSFLAED